MRLAYVEREIKPTLDELSEEFGGSVARISKVSVDESWGIARADRIEKRLLAAEAGQIILKAVSGDQSLSDAAKNTALIVLRQLGELAERLDQTKADSTRADVLNNISFALSNTCNALKTMGVVGISKTLNDAGKEDNGRWNPQMLSQINLTVQNLVAAGQGGKDASAQPAEKPATPATEPDKPVA